MAHETTNDKCGRCGKIIGNTAGARNPKGVWFHLIPMDCDLTADNPQM